MKVKKKKQSFITVTAAELWKGALAETGAGARKGRGKRTKKKRRKDLNRGQIIGEGKLIKTANVLFRFYFPNFIGIFTI